MSGLTICDKIFHKNSFTVFCGIAGTLFGTTDLTVAIACKDAEKFIYKFLGRSATLTELLQSIGSFYLRICFSFFRHSIAVETF